ncbi:MAG: hypothetical protein KDE03_05355 [Rhodobacteraceae bacterium]|nr:hypothetical protein [Paracoccaceae bacterium]
MSERFKPVRDDQIAALVALWDRAGMTRPWNPAADDIARLRAQPAAEGWAGARGVIKLMLVVRDTNQGVIGFYERLGYSDAGVRVMPHWLTPERARAYEAGHA